MKGVLATLLVGLTSLALAQDKPHSSAAAAAKMRASVERVLAALPEKSRAQAMRPFEDRDRTDWHYTPRSRNGLSFKEMDKAGRDAVHGLLRTALSATGYRKAVNIIELEIVLREIETFGWMRDPERYHLTVYGAPDPAKRWGWRFEGHHLSLNFTLAGDKLAADTPSFFGANPATVATGPRMGLRALGEEHDAGWALLESLGEAQRREAVFEARTYGDIVTANKDKAAPLDAAGIAAAKLDGKQRELLWKLIEVYAGNFEAGLAQARLARARQAIETLRFGWAGSTARGKPHYYRVQGPLFLIEYDASQNDGNHIHTVWRDFSGDFGRDLLREHYSFARGTSHRH
ncbi:MAG TPA: DUF3500 domain-containing protein [Burkholderiales bacterium]|nr:DUF3500 domain-containing protein [Burkholderiales bacterium]